MTLVIVGGTTEPQLEEAVGVFLDTGFQLARWLSPFDESDGVLPLRGDGAAVLRDADVRGIRRLVQMYVADKRLLSKPTVTLYEAVQEFWVAERARYGSE